MRALLVLALAVLSAGVVHADVWKFASASPAKSVWVFSPVLPAATVKACHCTNQCVCGCNEGKACQCGKVQSAPGYPPGVWSPSMIPGYDAGNCATGNCATGR